MKGSDNIEDLIKQSSNYIPDDKRFAYRQKQKEKELLERQYESIVEFENLKNSPNRNSKNPQSIHLNEEKVKKRGNSMPIESRERDNLNLYKVYRQKTKGNDIKNKTIIETCPLDIGYESQNKRLVLLILVRIK